MKIFCVVLALLLTGVCVAFLRPVAADGMPAVIISELLWMGSSASSNDEWIELRNTTSSAIDLTNWRLTKLSNGVEAPMLTIPSGSIPAGGFFLIANDPAATSRLAIDPQLVDSAVSLVNSKLQVSLYDTGGTLIDRADDGTGAPLAGEYQSNVTWKSMERNPSGADGTQPTSWHTASTSVGFDDALKEFGTPAAINSNQAPTVAANIPTDGVVGERVYFDASETNDPEGDTVTVEWSFGDGDVATGTTTEHVYQTAGSFRVTVTASDGTASALFESVITVAQGPITTTPSTPKSVPLTGAQPSGQSSKFVRFNELFPNPEGRDAEREFIELANIGDDSVDLFGWKLSVGADDYRISSHLVLPSQSFLAFSSSETHLTLKNSGRAELFLVDPNGAIVNGVAYTGASEGKAFARTEQRDWKWTDPTPGAANRFAATLTRYAPDATTGAVHLVAIGSAKTLPRLTDVRVRGTVVVPPGVLSASFFYIEDGGNGIQIFSSKHAFPDLAVGDVVEILGAVGESNGERKINVRDAEDIAVVDSGDAPEALPFTPELGSGVLVVVEGVLTAKQSTSVNLETASGTIRVTFARSAGIDRSSLIVGSSVRATGLWRVTKDGGRIYPRDGDDIEMLGSVKGETTQSAAAVHETGSQVIVSSADQRTNRSAVSLAASVLPPVLLLTAVSGYVWWKKRRTA